MKNQLKTLALAFTAFCFTACNTGDIAPKAVRTMTTQKLTFTADGKSQTFTFKNLTGKAKDWQVDKVVLAPNKTYDLSVEFLKENVSPVEDITKEINLNKDDYMLFYKTVSSKFEYTDKDNKGLPIGLKGTFKSGAAGTETIRIDLAYKPNKANKSYTDHDIAFGIQFDATIK